MPVTTRLLGTTIGAATLIGASAVALMMLHITADVIAKFVFSWPLPGTIAIVSQYYMVAVVFVPLAFAERRNMHISVEVLAEHFPFPVQRRLNFGATTFSVAVFGMLAWRGLEEAVRKQDVGTFIIEQGVRIDTWPAYYLVPLGTGLMVLTLVYKLARYLRGGPESDTSVPF